MHVRGDCPCLSQLIVKVGRFRTVPVEQLHVNQGGLEQLIRVGIKVYSVNSSTLESLLSFLLSSLLSVEVVGVQLKEQGHDWLEL
jgi:hypothetical protein